MMAILIAIVMILSALVIALPGSQGREYGMNPAATALDNIQPNPMLNTNVTWSTFYNGWSPLEYSNGTANLSLNTQLSSIYANPISINPAGIVAPGVLQNDKVGQTYWNDTSAWSAPTSTQTDGSIVSFTSSTSSGITTLSLTGNTSASGTSGPGITYVIPISSLPSNNPNYDYITVIDHLSGTTLTGVETGLWFGNGTTTNYAPDIYPGQTQYISLSLTQISKLGSGQFNLSGKGAAQSIRITMDLSLPQVSSHTYTATLNALALTTAPLTLGTRLNNGTFTTVTNGTQNSALYKFSPSFAWQAIDDSSYTVATSQTMQNATTQQSAINALGYIEQVEYQGQFNLPTAPDLSYGPANLTEHFNVSTSQTQVLDINGVSYLSTISGKNGTIQLLSSVNPNSQTQFLQIVDYTQSQWTSISSPPGIFTLAGIEYYWEEFILAILAVVGVGAGAASRHASNLRKVK